MSKHVISVCIFCFICATHSPCASHVSIGNEYLHKQHNELLKDPNGSQQPILEVSVRDKSKNENNSEKLGDGASRTDIKLVKREIVNQDEEYLKKIFALYGDGESMKMEGFERLMKSLLRIVANKKPEEIERTSNNSRQMVRNAYHKKNKQHKIKEGQSFSSERSSELQATFKLFFQSYRQIIQVR